MQRKHGDEYCCVNWGVWSVVSFRLCNKSHSVRSQSFSFPFYSVLQQHAGSHWYLNAQKFLIFLYSLVFCCKNSCLAVKNLHYLSEIKPIFFATHNTENVFWFFPLTFEHPIIMLFVARRQSSQVEYEVTLEVNYPFLKWSKIKSFLKSLIV